MQSLYDVVQVEATDDYCLSLSFEDGVAGVFDMKPLLRKQPFSRLKSRALFKEARVGYGTVVWPGGIDIAPETLRDAVAGGRGEGRLQTADCRL